MAAIGAAAALWLAGGQAGSAQQVPDLTVTRIDVAQPGPPLRVGSCNTVTVTVRNLANRNVPARVSMALAVEVLGSPARTYEQQLPSMAGNGTTTVTFSGVAVPDTAEVRLNAEVDPGSAVPEAIETNNARTQMQAVLGSCP
ncbi:MAG: CARDB domain-containing protein [Alphaproteobacteria bacterium]